MTEFRSKVDPAADDFKHNAAHNRALASDLRRLREEIEKEDRSAPARATARRQAARARAYREVLDPESSLARDWPARRTRCVRGAVAGGGIVCGIGTVGGARCMIVANDATVKGGTYYPLTVKKHLRAQEIALENSLPCIYLVDSGGAYLPLQDQVFPDRDHFGRIFYNQAQLSACGIPQIAVVMGSCTAGGAYVPAMCDETVIVKNQGTILIPAGPPLVKAAIGEDVDDETLGGGDVHTRISGVADQLADDDERTGDGPAYRRAFEPRGSGRGSGASAAADADPPEYPADDLFGLVPSDLRYPLNVREVSRASSTHLSPRVQAALRDTSSRARPHLKDQPVGIPSATTASVCRRPPTRGPFHSTVQPRRHPAPVRAQRRGLHGRAQGCERRGIAKDGAKLVTAVACARVPKLTLIVGGSFGAGNYGMCGRAYGPRFLWTWPTLADLR